MPNYKSQSQENYQKMYHLYQRKQCEVVNLEYPPPMQSLNYRFEWISEKPKNKKSQPLKTREPIHNINLPLGHFLSRNHNSFIDLKIDHKGEKNNNSPVTTIQSRKTTNNSSQRNKSYTVVHIKFDKLLQKKGSNISVDYKKINIMDQSQNKIKKKDCNLKIKGIDYSSSTLKKQKPSNSKKCEKYTELAEGCMMTECIELQQVNENTSVTPNDLKCERDLYENDNKFEITILNNQQLETKTIII